MSRNKRSKLRQDVGYVKRGKQKRKVDERIRRTRNRLGNALVALILEKPIDKLTVQEVLGRAGVGRSTFYLHFRDKNNLFLSVLEEGLEMWTIALTIIRHKRNPIVLHPWRNSLGT
jgi:AcrR family transcriptional regulator